MHSVLAGCSQHAFLSALLLSLKVSDNKQLQAQLTVLTASFDASCMHGF